MARQTGIVGIQGTVGNLTFRKDGSVSQAVGSRKITQARTLENNSEFGLAVKYSKLLRNALRAVIDAASDRYMTSRLAAKMLAIIKLDDVNDRDQRQYDSTNAAPLVGFDFNGNTSVGQVFVAPYTVTATGADAMLDIPALNLLNDIRPPQGATHYELVFAATSLDMVSLSATASTMAAPFGIQALNEVTQASVNITAAVASLAGELVVGVAGIRFYQLVNTKYGVV